MPLRVPPKCQRITVYKLEDNWFCLGSYRPRRTLHHDGVHAKFEPTTAMAISDESATKSSARDGMVSQTPSEKQLGAVVLPAAEAQEKPYRSWKSYIWDTFDKSPEERRFMFKLDLALMTLASLGYFIKYLDQVGLSTLCAESSMLTHSPGQH
jgi:hypothetical protein